MRHKKIEQYRRKQREIVKEMKEASERRNHLQTLALEVGAARLYRLHDDSANEQRLVDNINDALRTEAMIRACKTAGRNFWIALVAAIASILSAAAAWTAILFNVWQLRGGN